jgi:serine/threonine protein kinase
MRDRTGNYRLMYQLGRGGMGQVWGGVRVGREGMVMPCAIKVLHPALAQTPQEHERFYNEARIATQLDHGRIVKVIDISEVQGSPCLVMEWVDGVNLREFIEKVGARLDLDVCFIIGEILTAFVYAHERKVAGADAGVIHYDVKPENIMVSASGEIKLTDFGIARFAATADGTMSRSMGTPRYMSPEQMNGRARRETDIYSLGVVLHELLDGKRYLDGCDRQQLQTLVLDGYVPELDRADVPAWLDQLRRRMLASNADDRPSAAEALSLILQKTAHYQLASQQLRVLYQHHVGERRSGLTELVDTDDVPATYRRLRDERAPTPTPEIEPAQSELSRRSTKTGLPGYEAPITVTEVLEKSAPDGLPPVEVAPATRPPSRRWVWSGLAAGALILVGISVGVIAARPGDELATTDGPARASEPDEEPIVDSGPAWEPGPVEEPIVDSGPTPMPTPDPVPPAEPTPESATQHESVTQPSPDVQTEPTTEPTIEPEPSIQPESKPQKKQLRKVPVTFVIKGAAKAQLEVGSRSLSYNRMAMTDLRPGHYAVRWRESDDEPWHAAGAIDVAALSKGAYYEVQVGPKSVDMFERKEGSAK